ncbi:MAG: hypothetical protein WBW94_14455, partial [Anaerolineales bacterium]
MSQNPVPSNAKPNPPSISDYGQWRAMPSSAGSSSSVFDYGKWRQGFLQAILFSASAFGFISLAANFLTHASEIDLIIYSAAIIILLLVTIIPFPYTFKANVFLVLIYAIAISGFLETGIWGDARIYLLAFVIMASLLFSPRAGVITTIIGTLTTVIAGWLILTSQYKLTSNSVTPSDFGNWITGILTDILLSVVIIIGLRLVQREFERAREQAGSAFHKLEEESKNLELRVEERTTQLSAKSELLRSSVFVSRSVAEIQDVPTLLERAVHWTSE